MAANSIQINASNTITKGCLTIVKEIKKITKKPMLKCELPLKEDKNEV
jgi:hypothetical protein